MEKIGQGAFGSVYKVGDRVIKKMKVDGGIQYTSLREIAFYKCVNHPNIIGFLEVKYKKVYIELHMQYGGKNLQHYIMNVKLQVRLQEIDNIYNQIIDAVGYLHYNNIIHRDLKPVNILCDTANVIKLCDFGLCRKNTNIQPAFVQREETIYDLNGDQMTKNVCTLNYRAPELFSPGCDEYNCNIDVWSIGCILYEYIMRRHMFPGTKDEIVWEKIKSQLQPTREDFIDINLEPETYNTNVVDWATNLLFCDINVETIKKYKELISRMIVFNPAMRPQISEFTNRKKYSVTTTDKPHTLYLGIIPPPQMLQYIAYIQNQENIIAISPKTVDCALNILNEYSYKVDTITIELLDAMITISSKLNDSLPVPSKNPEFPKLEKHILTTIDFSLSL